MYPLSQGEAVWRKYTDILREDTKDHAMLVEFLCDGAERQFLENAEFLHRLLTE